MSDHNRPGLLDVLDAATRTVLVSQAHMLRVRKGRSVVGRGEPSDKVYIIQEGRLQVLLFAANGREVSLRELGPGQLFGELGAIDGEARSAGIVAATDARLLAVGAEAFRALLRESPPAADWLILRLISQVRALTDRVFELSALNVRSRLHCELMRLSRTSTSDVDPAPTHAELANRIGTHREAITRELNALADRKIIRSGRRRLEFLDIPKLEREVAASLRAPLGEAGWW